MAARKDFLRHIVNRVLANSNLPRQVVEDIRRMVGRAEDKYKFHAFGGDVKRLADYLRSQEFNDLIVFIRNVRHEKGEENPVEVLKKILLEAKEAYKDIPEVVEAIDERLKELESESGAQKSKIEILYEELRSLKDRYNIQVEADKEKKTVKLRYGDKLEANVTYNDATNSFNLSYTIRDEVTLETIGDIKATIRRLLELIREKARHS